MKLTAQSPDLPYLERLATHAEEDNAFAGVGLYALFLSLYNRLSRLFAIALLFSFSPIYVCSFLPYRVIALASEIPPFADCPKPADEYL